MSILEIEAKNDRDAISILESFSLSPFGGKYVFRGHARSEYRLTTTLSRFYGAEMLDDGLSDALGRDDFNFFDQECSRMINKFLFYLSTVGKAPTHLLDKRSKLEYVRHYGLPTPMIDFSYSPYVALWFAFNEWRLHSGNEKVYVYILNMHSVYKIWSDVCNIQGYCIPDYQQFKNDDNQPIFTDIYPDNVLQIISKPASWNVRMLRQKGLFIYDSLNYSKVGYKDLEELLSNHGIDDTLDVDRLRSPSIVKVSIPVSVGEAVFMRLNMMGVSGTNLYDNHEGAIADIKNMFFTDAYYWGSHDYPD